LLIEDLKIEIRKSKLVPAEWQRLVLVSNFQFRVSSSGSRPSYLQLLGDVGLSGEQHEHGGGQKKPDP
jgi:hypothetical protein